MAYITINGTQYPVTFEASDSINITQLNEIASAKGGYIYVVIDGNDYRVSYANFMAIVTSAVVSATFENGVLRLKTYDDRFINVDLTTSFYTQVQVDQLLNALNQSLNQLINNLSDQVSQENLSALILNILNSLKGQPNGLAGLDANGLHIQSESRGSVLSYNNSTGELTLTDASGNNSVITLQPVSRPFEYTGASLVNGEKILNHNLDTLTPTVTIFADGVREVEVNTKVELYDNGNGPGNSIKITHYIIATNYLVNIKN